MKRLVATAGAAAMLATAAAGPAQAEYIVNLEQSGLDVVATGSGSLNTTALVFANSAEDQALVHGSTGALLVGTGGGGLNLKIYTGLSGPTSFGSGDEFLAGDAAGNIVGVIGNDGRLAVPIDYGSGTDLGTSTALWSNATFASLGLTEGTYTWTWGSGDTADRFVLNIGAEAVVPEPATLAMLSAGLLGLGAARRRKSAA